MRMPLKALLLGAVLAAISLHGTLACQGKRMVFEDRFNTLADAWGRDDNVSVSGGTLRVQAPLIGGNLADHLLNQSNVYTDIDECITVQFIGADDLGSASAGLAFWGTDDDHYYMLVVDPTGDFIVMHKVAAQRNLIPIGWTQNSAIRQGLNAGNELEVITNGNHASLFINGVLVNELDGEAPPSGSLVGVYWAVQPNHNMAAAFSDLKVMK
jgi:hypothetical protein